MARKTHHRSTRRRRSLRRQRGGAFESYRISDTRSVPAVFKTYQLMRTGTGIELDGGLRAAEFLGEYYSIPELESEIATYADKTGLYFNAFL